ncbi:hypothetical protein ACS3QZ_16780 [Shimia sp. W99]|uniref:Uncharacterized protein n=1 Tax=Shimia aestuarii TaxID=254406 RepID=A0A1I4MSH4_9RHOB|nr:hypothetical protein SAMN04488042_103227 [Shimia aestuarii]
MRGGPHKKPLFRKVNTRTFRVRHGCPRLEGRDGNTKKARVSEATQQGMRQGLRHGLDYTPLYKFLLSKVGQPWDAVYSEAVARLEEDAAIWHLVARSEVERRAVVRCGESSFYSGLHVDEAGRLAKVDPGLDASSMRPDCACCTHTFNGERFGLPFEAP